MLSDADIKALADYYGGRRRRAIVRNGRMLSPIHRS
jgi:hypothetical protein